MAAAAAADSMKRIKAEATCSICLELLRNPVTTACGHSFCKRCITRLCQGRKDATCPQCRQPLPEGSLKPNQELKKIVELFSPQAKEKPAAGNTCERHQEPLKLYCKEDETLICLVCRESQAHRGHTVAPMDEARQEYREKIEEQLGVIESSCGKLHQFVNQVWKHLPENEQDEKYQSMKRVCEKLTAVLQVHTGTPEERSGEPSAQPPASPSPARDVSEDTERQGHSEREPSREQEHGRRQASLDTNIHRISDTRDFEKSKIQPLGSERKSISLGKKISTDAESQGQKAKESGEQTSEKVEKTRSHVVHASEEASVPNKEYLDPIIHQISGTTDDAALSQVAVRSLRQRFEGPTSPKESPDSGLRSGKILTPAGLAQTGQVSSTEHGREKAAEKQEAAPSRVGDETPTPQCGVGKTPPELPAPSATPSVGEAEGAQPSVRDLRQRFEGPTSPKESPDSGFGSGKNVTLVGPAQTRRVGFMEDGREKAAEKQEAAPSRVGDETPTPQCGVGKTPPELPAPSATPAMGEAEGAQVGVTDLRKRFEGPVSPKDSPDSGLTSWKLGTSSGHTRAVHVGSQEKRREKAAEKQEAAPSRVGDETPTPQCGVGKTPPELPAPSATPAMGEAEGAQVHVTDLRQRFEGHVSGPRGGREMDKTCFSAAGASSTGNGETVPASSVSPWVP